MKVGDKVRVLFNKPPHEGLWYGHEGVLDTQHYNHNWEVRITKHVGTDPAPYNTWGEEDLELIEPEKEPDELTQSIKKWEAFLA